MGFFSWISEAVKQAVLRGFADAAAELQLDHDAAAADPLAALQQRMTPPLPPPSSNGTPARRGRS